MDFDLSPDQLALKQGAHEFAAMWRGRQSEWDREDECPYDEVVAAYRDTGLLGLTMPTEYGGQGRTALDYALVVEEIFRTSQSWIVAEPMFCTTGPGPSMIALAHTDAAKAKFLPDVVSGAKGCAIALTEPLHGSDLTHLETRAVLEGDEYVVNGAKRFITGAPANELYAVFARLDDVPGHKGIGCIIVEKGTHGLELARGARFLGTRGLPHGEVHLNDCRVPRENLVSGAGSFAELMTAFNMERLHNSVLSLGLAQAAWDETVAYCEERQAFGKDVIQFQAAYHALVDMHVNIEAQRLLTYRAAATATDGRFPKPLDSTVAKLFGSTMLPQLTMTGAMLHGGDGVTLDFAIQRLHRDAVSAMVAGGSPPVLRNAIASMLFPHRHFPQT